MVLAGVIPDMPPGVQAQIAVNSYKIAHIDRSAFLRTTSSSFLSSEDKIEISDSSYVPFLSNDPSHVRLLPKRQMLALWY